MKTAQTHSTRVAADNALAAEKRLTPVGCRDGYTQHTARVTDNFVPEKRKDKQNR